METTSYSGRTSPFTRLLLLLSGPDEYLGLCYSQDTEYGSELLLLGVSLAHVSSYRITSLHSNLNIQVQENPIAPLFLCFPFPML